jgi:hypothetical protein
MAGLTWALIATREIVTSGGSFTVRGLDAEDIFGLLARRRADVEAFYAAMLSSAGGQSELSLDQANGLAGRLIGEAPEIAAEIVAIAAGPGGAALGDDDVAIARAIPFPAKLAALEAIAELTFTSEMPPKKVIETVVRMLGGLTRSIGSLSASQLGAGESASD